jgi:hypothetical protein
MDKLYKSIAMLFKKKNRLRIVLLRRFLGLELIKLVIELQ